MNIVTERHDEESSEIKQDENIPEPVPSIK
jgi:hypothetical protein